MVGLQAIIIDLAPHICGIASFGNDNLEELLILCFSSPLLIVYTCVIDDLLLVVQMSGNTFYYGSLTFSTNCSSIL